ncbi:peptidylprolyl isomerase [Sphingomonas sp. 28-63-12]|uniref:peptidylprolyl isomerase n=1 Tax=Sphingomonas sp. 28-63-12 TaxID=1970434 RepID=UPI000BD941D6|nr:MAG: peptidylprolyl isomerase [Sphingomonas sp. 28-63-12]
MVLRPAILAVLALALTLTGAAEARRASPGGNGLVRVRLVTSEGPIVLALEARRAPATTANFLAYVDDGQFDGTSFYRAARRKADPRMGFIQGGIQTDARRILPPFAFEPTSKTGVLHLDGAISMARRADPKSAGGNFIITLGPIPSLDAHGDQLGYAAFGHVVSGRATMQRILAAQTGGGSEAMRGQMILHPIRLIRAERIDGTPRPTGQVKPWLIKVPR